MNLFFLKSFLFFCLIFNSFVLNVSPQNIEPINSEVRISAAEQTAFALAREWNQNAATESISKFRQTADDWKKLEKYQNAANNLREAAKLAFRLGNKTQAEQFLTEALKISDEKNLPTEKIKILCELAHLKMNLGQMPESRELLDKAAVLAEKSQDSAAQATYIYIEGEYYFYIYDLENAVGFYQKSLDFWDKTDKPAEKAKIFISLGYCYGAQSEFDLSLKTLQEALAIYRQNNNLRGETLTHIAIGATFTLMGEKQKSLESYRKAERMFPEELDLIEKATLFNGLAYYFENYGEYNLSLDYRKKAYALFLRENHLYGQVSTLWSIGKISYLIGENTESLDYIMTGKALAEKLNDKFYQAIFNEELGNLYLLQADADKALQFFQKGVDLMDKKIHQRFIARIFDKFGQIYLRKKDFPRARRYLTDAAKLNLFVRDKFAEAENLYHLAALEQSEKNDEKALELIKNSIEITENLSSDVVNTKLRSTYFSNVFDRYELYINILMKLHRRSPDKNYAVRALQAAEKSRARSIIENLSLSEANFTKDADPETIKREKDIRVLLNVKADKLTDLLSQKAEKTETDKISGELDELKLELEEIKATLKQNSPIYSAIKNPEPFNVPEFQNLILDEDSIFLEFSFGKTESYLWLIGKNEAASFILPAREEIESKVEVLRELIGARVRKKDEPLEDYQARIARSDTEFPETAQQLSNLLFGQINDKLANKRLIIVPDGKLHYFPISALPLPHSNTNEPILLANEVIYAPSASTLVLITKNEKTAKTAVKNLLVFSDPVFTEEDSRFSEKKTEIAENISENDGDNLRFAETLNSLARLAESKAEGDSIAKIAGASNSDIFTGFAATRRQFLDVNVSDYKILHFATHGLINETRPELSGIIFSRFSEKREKLDEFIRLQDIYNLDLNADLVVLSACETAVGKEEKGEGLVSLNNAFLQVGAKTVLSSLWKVEDAATVELMKNFYEIMVNEKATSSKALQTAQKKMWESGRYKSPFYWAAFTMQGDFRRVPDISSSRTSSTLLFLLIVPIIFAGGIFAFYKSRKDKKIISR